MNNNILLISDDENIKNQLTNQLVLLRNSDKITTCPTKEAKKIIENSSYCVIILYTDNNDNFTLKLIKNIKEIKPEAQLILYLSEIESDYILKAYDTGIYDYISTNTENWEILIKVINCFKYNQIFEKDKLKEKFLNQLDVFDLKTGLYKYNYIKEIFSEITTEARIQNGVFGILTLDDKIKTKVSSNRLAINIKNSMRSDDIIAIARGGLFYIIVPNIDISGTKDIINKIQSKMGEEFIIHSGLTKIGKNSFETIEKNAKDSLQSAIQTNEICVSLTDNLTNGDIWLEEENNPNKQFLLFQNVYEKKLENIIIPLFYRFQKECETKFADAKVIQYANKVESVFNIKNKNKQSELVIHFNGYTKIKTEINHKGLETPENTILEFPLNKFTEKELAKLLKQLKNEFKQG